MFQKNPQLMAAWEIGQFKSINKETASLLMGKYVDYLFEFANKHRSSQDLQRIADLYKFAAACGHGKAKECYKSLLPQLLALRKEDQRQLPSAANLIGATVAVSAT